MTMLPTGPTITEQGWVTFALSKRPLNADHVNKRYRKQHTMKIDRKYKQIHKLLQKTDRLFTNFLHVKNGLAAVSNGTFYLEVPVEYTEEKEPSSALICQEAIKNAAAIANNGDFGCVVTDTASVLIDGRSYPLGDHSAALSDVRPSLADALTRRIGDEGTLAIGLNAHYLALLQEGFGDKGVTLIIEGPDKPITVLPLNATSSSARGLLMPMRFHGMKTVTQQKEQTETAQDSLHTIPS